MKAYAVRFDANQKRPRELVGFFIADDLVELYALVDECCEVEGCEAIELGNGGVYWDEPVDYVLPIEESETAPGLPGEGSMTDAWMGALCSERQWSPLVRIDLEGANDR